MFERFEPALSSLSNCVETLVGLEYEESSLFSSFARSNGLSTVEVDESGVEESSSDIDESLFASSARI
jgi:hypothetical protein